MQFFTYHLGPIDFGWENLQTVEDTAARIGGDEARSISAGNGSPCVLNVSTFLSIWDSAKRAANDAGWEGDFRNDPVVFWLPHEDGFICGFVIKQDNNGSTFVVSPHPLPWLDSQ